MDSSLSILSAGIQSGEDAPFISSGFSFLPGDSVFATFQIAGFKIKSGGDEQPRTISLQYSVTMEDANGVAMAAPQTGNIDDEIGKEDKDWTPKRRVSFALPQLIASGKARLHFVVKDLLAKAEVSRDVPFAIGGVTVERTATVSVQRLQFFRKENDRDPVEVAAFAPGDPLYLRFELVGFKIGPQNEYHVTYDLLVQGPDGKAFIQQPHAADLAAATFYPAQLLPDSLKLTTNAKSAKGSYTVLLTVHDLITNKTGEGRASFTIE